MRHPLRTTPVLFVTLLAACTDVDEPAADGSAGTSDAEDGTSGAPATGGGTADSTGGTASDGTGGIPLDRGPTELPIDGDANGLWWDADEGALYVADDNGNRILRWSDADGFSLIAELPLAPEDGAGLGQLVRLDDGTLVVTRFGHGTAGDVIVVPPDADAYAVPGLDPERRRIGLTVATDGVIYDSWFVRVGDERVGAIGELDLDGGEVVVLDGLVKPVSVVAEGDALVVVDQDLGQVLRAPRADPSNYEIVASDLAGADLLALGPDGSYFIGGADGSVRQIGADGAVEVFAGGFVSVRGVAFDAGGGRLFAAEHDTDESDGLDHALQIVPVEPS